MKQLILFCLLLCSLAPRLKAEAPPRPELKEEPTETPKISTGERIEIPDVGFSIVPPNGWMVHKNSHGSSLLFETPKAPNQSYQPTIQVMVFSKLRYIDAVTMKEYGDLIVEKFGKISNRISGYRLRDAAVQRLETGDPAILYYTEFQYDDVPIMQMHIMISSASNHFLMTYTDISKVFEDEKSPGLAIAYTSMHSAQLSTRPPWRWRGFAIAGGAMLFIIIGWFSLRFVRARRLARMGQHIEDEDNKEITEDTESDYYSRHVPATYAESHAGDEEWAADKGRVKSPPPKRPMEKVSQVQNSHFDEDDEPEVSEIVPISTLEKSLHPARKRRQAVAAEQHQAPPIPQPGLQQPNSEHQKPASNQQALQQGLPPDRPMIEKAQGIPIPQWQAAATQNPAAMMVPQAPAPLAQEAPASKPQISQARVPQQGMPQAQPYAPATSVPMAQASHPDFIPDILLHSQPPVSEQPAYVQKAYAPAARQDPTQAYTAEVPATAPAPMAQMFAPPEPSAPVMSQFESADDPVTDLPITSSRQPKNQAMRKQFRSHEMNDEPEMTEEARLSVILPKAGTIEKSKPKRKGLFWRKKADDDDDRDDGGNDKDSWAMAADKKFTAQSHDDDEALSDDQWAAPATKKSKPEALASKHEDEPAESDVWAPEATKKSVPKRNSLLNETQGPQRLVRQTPQGLVTKANHTSVTEDGWNLTEQVASDHDEEDEEEVG